MEINLSDQVALVTGAGGGIGGATARRLGDAGAQIAGTDINEASLSATVHELRSRGREADAFVCDLTGYGTVAGMVGRVVDRFGRIDILAHVAGGSVNKTSPFMGQDPSTWSAELARNLMSTIYVCRAVLEQGMLERGSGSIVIVSSDAGRVGSLGEAVYSAAKGGQAAFMKSLAREMGRHGIRVNCVSPGPTDTQQTREAAASGPRVMEKIVSMIAMKRIATVEEQANAIVFLASELASYITGQVISVNGGLQMV